MLITWIVLGQRLVMSTSISWYISQKCSSQRHIPCRYFDSTLSNLLLKLLLFLWNYPFHVQGCSNSPQDRLKLFEKMLCNQTWQPFRLAKLNQTDVKYFNCTYTKVKHFNCTYPTNVRLQAEQLPALFVGRVLLAGRDEHDALDAAVDVSRGGPSQAARPPAETEKHQE